MKTLLALLPLALGVATAASAQDLQRGHDQFARWCAPCHAPLTEFHPQLAGTSALQKKYNGSVPAALEQRTDLPAAQLAFFIRHGVNAMPPFRKTEISDADINAIAAYLARNAPR